VNPVCNLGKYATTYPAAVPKAPIAVVILPIFSNTALLFSAPIFLRAVPNNINELALTLIVFPTLLNLASVSVSPNLSNYLSSETSSLLNLTILSMSPCSAALIYDVFNWLRY
jgi:hypothetical protein